MATQDARAHTHTHRIHMHAHTEHREGNQGLYCDRTYIQSTRIQKCIVMKSVCSVRTGDDIEYKKTQQGLYNDHAERACIQNT